MALEVLEMLDNIYLETYQYEIVIDLHNKNMKV